MIQYEKITLHPVISTLRVQRICAGEATAIDKGQHDPAAG